MGQWNRRKEASVLLNKCWECGEEEKFSQHLKGTFSMPCSKCWKVVRLDTFLYLGRSWSIGNFRKSSQFWQAAYYKSTKGGYSRLWLLFLLFRLPSFHPFILPFRKRPSPGPYTCRLSSPIAVLLCSFKYMTWHSLVSLIISSHAMEKNEMIQKEQ